MDSATWCRTPAAASAARRLRPEVSKNFSTALSSNEGELARSITTCVPAMASLRPSPVMVSTPVFGEAATTSWLRWRRMATVFEPIKPVPPMTTIFIANLLVRSPQAGFVTVVPSSARFRSTFRAVTNLYPRHPDGSAVRRVAMRVDRNLPALAQGLLRTRHYPTDLVVGLASGCSGGARPLRGPALA